MSHYDKNYLAMLAISCVLALLVGFFTQSWWLGPLLMTPVIALWPIDVFPFRDPDRPRRR